MEQNRAANLEPVALTWRVLDRSGQQVVEFAGEIDENADFGELRRRLRGAVTFDLAEVRRINSCGVREWVNFVRELGAPGPAQVDELTFVSCSPAIVTQLNMIYNFRGHAHVRSFLAPYVCQECDHEESKLLEVAEHFPGPGKLRRPPDFTCPRCAGNMEFDDLPERYLSFLNDAA
jgi:hypothetical protein